MTGGLDPGLQTTKEESSMLESHGTKQLKPKFHISLILGNDLFANVKEKGTFSRKSLAVLYSILGKMFSATPCIQPSEEYMTSLSSAEKLAHESHNSKTFDPRPLPGILHCLYRYIRKCFFLCCSTSRYTI